MKELVKKVEFVVEDLETFETYPMVVENIQMGRSKRRQHSLSKSLQARDKESMKPRECFGLAGLVVSCNVEAVVNMSVLDCTQ